MFKQLTILSSEPVNETLPTIKKIRIHKFIKNFEQIQLKTMYLTTISDEVLKEI